MGKQARVAVEQARRSVAQLLNTLPRRIIFTAGGTEADNFAIKGIAFAHQQRGRHIISSRIEHPAILQSCAFLQRLGFDVSYLDVDEYGRVTPDSLEQALRPDTILVSVMLANNEVGTLQPIKQLCAIAHRQGALFHCDAVQAMGKIPVDVVELDVDLLTLSGHKFHGPKGIGVLYKKHGVAIEPLIHGGNQEGQLRGGTENVPGIVGLGKAAEMARAGLSQQHRLQQLRDRLQQIIMELIPTAQLNGHPEQRLPNTLNMMLPTLRGESIVVALDQHGVSLSSGSACKSGSPDPTHVLLAMGKSEEHAHCSVRFSLSHQTTEEDILHSGEALRQVLHELTATVRFLSCK
jgi:cysteine desulfurase NifS